MKACQNIKKNKIGGAVRDIPNKLAAFGYIMVPRRNHETEFELSAEVHKNKANIEHDRWAEAKLKEGWKYDPQTNNEKRLHSLLMKWDQLTENEKENDRQIFSKISSLLNEAGYAIEKDMSIE